MKFQCELEIDSERGVIYAHLTDPKMVNRIGAVTILRMCGLPKPIPTDKAIDITYGKGCSWSGY